MLKLLVTVLVAPGRTEATLSVVREIIHIKNIICIETVLNDRHLHFSLNIFYLPIKQTKWIRHKLNKHIKNIILE